MVPCSKDVVYGRNVPPYLPVHLFLVRLQIDEDHSPPLCYFVACKVKTLRIETDLPVKQLFGY